MIDVTVRCGCGRDMLVDSRRGRGAYRCGCGGTIQIDAPRPPEPKRWTGCVGERDGEPCEDPVVRTRPFRMCDHHFEVSGIAQYQEWRRMSQQERVAQFTAEQIVRDQEAAGFRRIPGEGTLRIDERPIVYFIQSGEYVKIGATVNLVQRLQSITVPQEPIVLLTLDGYKVREKEFHHRFARLRCNREWFHLKDELLEFINAERAIHGLEPAEAINA